MDTALNQVLTSAVIRILRPLVRVLIRHEMSHAEFAELARQAYVQEAYANFGIEGRKMTYSRVAVLTGLTRKEVVRLVKLDESEAPLTLAPNRAVRVIEGWLSDAEFLIDGKPKMLPLHGDAGSFSALVAKYSGDITLGAVLDELERVGVVNRPDKKTVELTSAGYIPQADELEKVRIMSICTADQLGSAIQNLDAEPGKTLFQRQFSYQNVPHELADEFREEAATRSAQLLEDLQAFYTEKKSKTDLTESDTEPVHKVGLGIYHIDETNLEQT